jgi:hypothetical protein
MRALVVIALAFVAVTTSSCACTGREFVVKKNIKIHRTANETLCQTDKLTFNLTEDKAISDLKNNLGKIEVRGLAVRIINPKSTNESVATKGNGHVDVAETVDGERFQVSTYSDVALTANNYKQLDFDKAQAERIARLALNAPNTFFIDSVGCTDAVPADFEFAVELTLYAELKLF